MQYRVLYDYAINTGRFYEKHCALARDGANMLNWRDHVVKTLLPRYRRECYEPHEGMSGEDISALIHDLRDYYVQHLIESDAS